MAHGRNNLAESRAIRALCNVLWKKGEYEEQRKYLDEGLKLAEDSSLYEEATLFLNLYGMSYSDTGDFEIAQTYYLRAITNMEKINKDQHFAMIYNNLGDTYLQLEESDEAIKNFNLCKEYAEKIHNEKWIAWSLLNIAEALAQKGEADKCIDACEEAIPLLEFIDDKYGLMSTYRNAALGYSIKGDWGKVDDYLEKSLELLKPLKSPFQNGYFNYLWGLIELNRGDKKLAEEKLNKARDNFNEINSQFYVDKIDKIKL